MLLGVLCTCILTLINTAPFLAPLTHLYGCNKNMMHVLLITASLHMPVSTEDCTAGLENQNMNAVHKLKSSRHQSYECIIS